MNQTTKRVKKEGEIVKRPTFAKTLKTIAEHGVQVFYNGSIGKKMVQDVRKKGGIISERDLLAYRYAYQSSLTECWTFRSYLRT